MNSIAQNTLQFLHQLSQNNNREWFTEHKNEYVKAQENMIAFADDFIVEMNKHDQLENVSGKKSLYRIYNDVRFKKDKSPYNVRFSFGLQRATEYKRGGYYVHIEPGNNFIACGFFAPNPSDLLRIRKDIEVNYNLWNSLLQNKNLKSNFGELFGEALKTAPKGFDKDHPAIELLRYKQYLFQHNFTDQEVLKTDFLANANQIFQSIRPFFDHMSEVLTTNINGESIV